MRSADARGRGAGPMPVGSTKAGAARLLLIVSRTERLRYAYRNRSVRETIRSRRAAPAFVDPTGIGPAPRPRASAERISSRERHVNDHGVDNGRARIPLLTGPHGRLEGRATLAPSTRAPWRS